MRKIYDVIIVGAGSMGMSAGDELARRGMKVLLLDAFDPPHSRGSHHGESRLIRHAYQGGASYCALALRADERWLELEKRVGRQLLVRSGVINIGDPEVCSFEERRADAESLGIQVESLGGRDLRERWPGIQVPDDFTGLYEPHAGYLLSERCVAAFREQALHNGAELLTNTPATAIRANGSGVTVVTPTESFTAAHAIVSAGARFGQFASFASLPIRAVRKVVAWFEPLKPSAYDDGLFPGFTLATQNGAFYGFPSIDGAGLKIGRHDGGREWNPDGEEPAPFGADPDDEGDLRAALESYMPGAAGRLLKGVVCKYEFTPDEDFIIDRHPEHHNVLLAGGFSGHGFKFASVVGEVLADLTERGTTRHDISQFSVARFDPDE